MISSLATKCQHFRLRGLQFHYTKWLKNLITKFKSQGLYTIKIKYWNAGGSGFPPSLIPALWNIGILHHEKAKLRKHMRQSVISIHCRNSNDESSFYEQNMYKMSVSSTYLHITIKHTGSHIDKNFSTPVLGQFNHRGLYRWWFYCLLSIL